MRCNKKTSRPRAEWSAGEWIPSSPSVAAPRVACRLQYAPMHSRRTEVTAIYYSSARRPTRRLPRYAHLFVLLLYSFSINARRINIVFAMRALTTKINIYWWGQKMKLLFMSGLTRDSSGCLFADDGLGIACESFYIGFVCRDLKWYITCREHWHFCKRMVMHVEWEILWFIYSGLRAFQDVCWAEFMFIMTQADCRIWNVIKWLGWS